MTEERVGVIEKTFWNKLRITNLPDASEVRDLIRAIAAEVQEEDREKVIKIVEKLIKEQKP